MSQAGEGQWILEVSGYCALSFVAIADGAEASRVVIPDFH